MMELVAYPVGDFRTRPAPMARQWMDDTDKRFAYRCLPLNIANSHGWEVLCCSEVTATWNGGAHKTAIAVEGDGALSHFGHGILTFHVNAVFRTPPGWDLYVTGPVNHPHDVAIQPLNGIVETSGTVVATFTMNWRFIKSQASVHFSEGQPFCTIFPVARINGFRPVIRNMSDDPDIDAGFRKWQTERTAFLKALGDPGSEAYEAEWQKDYFRAADQTKLRLRSFA